MALALLAALGTPGGASADTPKHHPYQAWAAAARVPLPPGTLRVAETAAPCGHQIALGCTRDGLIELNPWRAEARETLMHEIGHIWDMEQMRDWQRDRFREVVHAPAELPWDRTQDQWQREPLREWFADAYALCAKLHLERRPHVLADLGFVGMKALRRTCWMIRHTAS